MKVLKEKYPKGTLKYQKSDGRYIDGFLYENLNLMADKIVDDMTFMGVIFSSTLEVGTGKSVLATQIGEVWSDLIKQKHGIDLNWGLKNLVWRPKELIDRAFQIPKYSFLLLDEWEDAHYWSELGTTLRQFFRKCRQLNLFIMVIIPNWFQLPMSYAISRSIFAIDVKFGDGFERGYFDFYGFEAKKDLYVRGKKFHNYHAAKPDFDGIFNDGYGVNEAEYRRKKREDMEKWDEDEKKPKVSIYDEQCKIIQKIHAYVKKKKINFSQKQMGEALGKSQQGISFMITKDLGGNEGGVSLLEQGTNPYVKVQSKKDTPSDDGNEEEQQND